MAKKRKRGSNGNGIDPVIRSAAADAFHQRFLFLSDEALGKLLRDNPEVEQRVNELTAEIYEIMARGLRRQASSKR